MTGSVVYATNQGLGILAKQLHDNGVIDRVLIVRHDRHPTNTHWFKDWRWFDRSNYAWLLECDKLLFLETPFDWNLVVLARDTEARTVLMPDECTPYPLRYVPDSIWCPTEMEMGYNPTGVLIPFPTSVKWKKRDRARVFIHNAGHGGLRGRNGTRELIDALPYVKSPIELIIRTQTHEFDVPDKRVKVIQGTVPYDELWEDGDVFIFPDKFAGLSMPMQEAYASGMLVMGSNRSPNNTYLPVEPLIPVKGYRRDKIGVEFDSAVISPQAIAETIDAWYDRDISEFSLKGKAWAEQNSWVNIKPKLLSL